METHTCRSLHIHVSLCTRCPSSPYSLWRARQETQARRVLIQLLMMFLVVQHLSWPPSAPQGMGFLKSPCPKFSASLKHSHPKEAGKKTHNTQPSPTVLQLWKAKGQNSLIHLSPVIPTFSEGKSWLVLLRCFVTPVSPKAAQPQGRGEAHSW